MAVVQNYMQEDSILIDKIVYELKSQGIFDQFRKECIADVDTKPAYQNLRQRVEGSVSGFLSKQRWSPDMNKNQVREMLRKNIYESGFLETGVERIVDQVVNPKINSIFLPKVTEVVYKFFGIEPENDQKNNHQSASDLLPTDLEAVSPESEKQPDDSNLDDSKIDEDESPPFEPLEEQSAYVPPEDNSVDSQISGFSDSNSKPMVVDTSNQDSMASKQSSDGMLSIVTSETDHEKNFENLSEKIKKDEGKSKLKSSHDKSKDRSRSERDRKDSKHSSSSKDRSRNGKSDHRDKDRKSHGSSSSHRHSSSHRSKESGKDKDRKDKDRSSRDKHKDDRRRSHHSESKSADRHKRDSHSSKSSHSRNRDSKKDQKKDASEADTCRKRPSDRRSTDRDSNDGQSGLKSSSGSFDSLTSSQVSQQEKTTTQDSNSNSNSNGESNSDAHEDSNITVLEEINDEISISAHSMKKRKNHTQIPCESQENKENKEGEVKNASESPPLRSVAVSAASWEALEAKLNESVANEQYYQQSYYDSPTGTPEKVAVVEEKVAPPVGEECHYFEREPCSKTERYVKFVSDLVGKLERNIEKHENIQQSKEDAVTGVKRKLSDTNTAVKQSNKRFNIEVHENFPLPLSPAESDNSVDKKSDISEPSDKKDATDVEKAKKIIRAPAKKQRYTSEDLYKPRPLFSGSRRRSGRPVGGVD